MNLIALLVTLIVLGLLFWLAIWLIDWIGLPEPFNKVIKVVIGLVVFLYLAGVLLGMTPMPHSVLLR